ncbi:hypothetical protein [Thermococcus sp.]
MLAVPKRETGREATSKKLSFSSSSPVQALLGGIPTEAITLIAAPSTSKYVSVSTEYNPFLGKTAISSASPKTPPLF